MYDTGVFSAVPLCGVKVYPLRKAPFPVAEKVAWGHGIKKRSIKEKKYPGPLFPPNDVHICGTRNIYSLARIVLKWIPGKL